MDEAADLQAQMVALRVAVEGLWISVLSADADPIGVAEKLRRQNTEALRGLDAGTPQAAAMRDAVVSHTEHLWKSIQWQLGGKPEGS